MNFLRNLWDSGETDNCEGSLTNLLLIELSVYVIDVTRDPETWNYDQRPGIYWNAVTIATLCFLIFDDRVDIE